MAESADFQEVQRAFAAHIRDPDSHPAPEGVEDRRMAIYRQLFFANISNLLGGTYPVLRNLIDDENWDLLIRGFMRDHRSHTPYFLKLPGEFLDYLNSESGLPGHVPSFAQELAQFEWTKLALRVSEDDPSLDGVDAQGNLLKGIPVVSPLARLLSFRYPVHQIGEEFQPESPSDSLSFLVVYRNLKDKVNFMEVNPVTARLLELIRESNGLPGETLLRQVAADIQHPHPDQVVQAGLEILEGLRTHDIILGIVRSDES